MEIMIFPNTEDNCSLSKESIEKRGVGLVRGLSLTSPSAVGGVETFNVKQKGFRHCAFEIL